MKLASDTQCVCITATHVCIYLICASSRRHLHKEECVLFIIPKAESTSTTTLCHRA